MKTSLVGACVAAVIYLGLCTFVHAGTPSGPPCDQFSYIMRERMWKIHTKETDENSLRIGGQDCSAPSHQFCPASYTWSNQSSSKSIQGTASVALALFGFSITGGGNSETEAVSLTLSQDIPGMTTCPCEVIGSGNYIGDSTQQWHIDWFGTKETKEYKGAKYVYYVDTETGEIKNFDSPCALDPFPPPATPYDVTTAREAVPRMAGIQYATYDSLDCACDEMALNPYTMNRYFKYKTPSDAQYESELGDEVVVSDIPRRAFAAVQNPNCQPTTMFNCR